MSHSGRLCVVMLLTPSQIVAALPGPHSSVPAALISIK